MVSAQNVNGLVLSPLAPPLLQCFQIPHVRLVIPACREERIATLNPPNRAAKSETPFYTKDELSQPQVPPVSVCGRGIGH